MATKQRIVYGATTRWSTDGTTFSGIPEAKGLAVPVVEVEYQDATNLDSPGGFREYVAGLKDMGEITIPCGYTSDGYETAFAHQTSGALIFFETTLPLETGQSTTGDLFEFTGLVRPQLQTNAVGEIIGMDIIIRGSGQPSFTKGS